MNKLLIIFYSIIFCSTLQSFDETLRPLLGQDQEEPVECTATSQEVTQEFNKHYKKSLLSAFKAFEIENDGIYTLLVTSDSKRELLGKLKYFFFPTIAKHKITIPSYAYIANISVARHLRGKGLGSALFNYVRHKEYPEKICYIQLNPVASDYGHENILRDKAHERLIHFYQNQGMIFDSSTHGNRLVLYLNESKNRN